MLGHGVRVAARQLADNHASPGAFADLNMDMTCRPLGDQFQLRMLVEECRIDSGGDVGGENFRIGLHFSNSSNKTQLVLSNCGPKEILLGLLSLGEVYFHGRCSSTLKPMSPPSCALALR